MTTYDFADEGQADGYLSHSVIRLNNDPIYVTRVRRNRSGGFNVSYIPTTLYNNTVERDERSDGTETVPFTDPNINLSPIPLGMVNMDGDAIHLQRIPYRQWKIGLTSRNCYAYSYANNEENINWRRYIQSMGFVNAVRNNYPTFDEVVAQVCNNTDRYRPRVMAFSRNFAINRTGNVFYYILGDVPIGNIQTDHIQLTDERFYLQQLLEQDGARCS